MFIISDAITISQPDEILIDVLQLIKIGCTATTTQIKRPSAVVKFIFVHNILVQNFKFN
ncbi:MAG: hypothetical protein ACNS62_15990 [Candidatus Cyclobacteriaceae bacterium M3_2C_046]